MGTFLACSEKEITPVDTPFAIYSKKEDIAIKLGDTRAEFEQILGPDERTVMEFTEENVERVEYWDNEGVFLDYDSDGVVIAIRFSNEDWMLENGLGIRSHASDVKAKYPEEFIHKFAETDDLWISYDENSNATEFSLDSHYMLRFRIVGGFVDMVQVQDSTKYPPLLQ